MNIPEYARTLLTDDQLDRLTKLWDAVEVTGDDLDDAEAAWATLKADQGNVIHAAGNAVQAANVDDLRVVFESRVHLSARLVAAVAAVLKARTEVEVARRDYFTAVASMVRRHLETRREEIAALEAEILQLQRVVGSLASQATTARQQAGRHQLELDDLVALTTAETAKLVGR